MVERIYLDPDLRTYLPWAQWKNVELQSEVKSASTYDDNLPGTARSDHERTDPDERFGGYRLYDKTKQKGKLLQERKYSHEEYENGKKEVQR